MNLLQIVLTSLSISAIYSVIALGFVVIYKGTKVVNLAQGTIMMLGVYSIFLMAPAIGFWAASAIGISVGALFAILIQFIIGAARTNDHLVATVITIGIDIMVTAELVRQIRDQFLVTGDPWGDDTIVIGDAYIPNARVAALVTSVVLIAIFFAVIRFTPFGVKMRAAASDPETSALMGISQRRVSIWSWGIGGGLAVVGGIFLAAFPSAGLDAHGGALAMAAIPAIIIGGMDSAEGAIIGGLIVGFSETITRNLVATFAPVLGDGLGIVVPYIIMLIVLLIRPSGLFGSKEISRV